MSVVSHRNDSFMKLRCSTLDVGESVTVDVGFWLLPNDVTCRDFGGFREASAVCMGNLVSLTTAICLTKVEILVQPVPSVLFFPAQRSRLSLTQQSRAERKLPPTARFFNHFSGFKLEQLLDEDLSQSRSRRCNYKATPSPSSSRAKLLVNRICRQI